MIYKIISEDKTEYAQAQSQLHLLQSYADECWGFEDIQEVLEISNEEAKGIMIKNTEYDENDPEDVEFMPLIELAGGCDFLILASTDFV